MYGLYTLDDSSGGVASMFSPVDEEWSGASDDGSDTERAPATADDDDGGHWLAYTRAWFVVWVVVSIP